MRNNFFAVLDKIILLMTILFKGFFFDILCTISSKNILNINANDEKVIQQYKNMCKFIPN